MRSSPEPSNSRVSIARLASNLGAMQTPRQRRLMPLVALVLASGLLSGCISTPSAKRVALDAVETLAVDPEVKECMIDKIEGYSEDEIQEIGDAAAEGNRDAIEDMTRFEADLRACTRSTEGD
jgi:outer membrane murein-binding lipoprotein Lpp